MSFLVENSMLIEPPATPGIARYVSTKSTKKDTSAKELKNKFTSWAMTRKRTKKEAKIGPKKDPKKGPTNGWDALLSNSVRAV